MSRKIQVPFVTKEWLIENWINTDKSLNDLSIEIGVNSSLLEQRASRFGLRKEFKHSINKEKLLDFRNPNVCYLAGLLATDGYLNTNSDFVSLTLVGESEKKLLEDILSYFESTDIVRQYRINNSENIRSSIRISCRGIKGFLFENFNIPAKDKTTLLGFPESFFNEDCKKAFLLGCFDGDGCISHFGRRSPTAVLLTKSQKFIDGLYDAISSISNVSCKKGTERGYPYVRLGGKINVKNFLDWLYSSTSVLRLERKYEKYLQVKDIV